MDSPVIGKSVSRPLAQSLEIKLIKTIGISVDAYLYLPNDLNFRNPDFIHTIYLIEIFYNIIH